MTSIRAMGQEVTLGLAQEDLSASIWRIVKITPATGNNTVELGGDATGEVGNFAVLSNSPAAAGAVCRGIRDGGAKCVAGGTWAIGNPLCVDNTNKGSLIVATTNAQYVIGRAEAVAAANDVARFRFTNEGLNSLADAT